MLEYLNMSQMDQYNTANTVMELMNDVYCTPNSTNEDRIRRNARMNTIQRANADKMFKQTLWLEWFARVEKDRLFNFPAAIDNMDRAEINTILDSYEGSPRIQAEFIAELYKLRSKLTGNQTWEQIIIKVVISPPETPDARDMFLVGCDVLMSTDKHDWKTNCNYQKVVAIMDNSTWMKLCTQMEEPSSIKLSNTIIDAMCHVLLQMYTGDMRKPPPNSESSEFTEGSSGEHIVFDALQILNRTLCLYDTDDWLEEDKLEYYNSVGTRLPKIAIILGWMMRAKNTERYRIINDYDILKTYLNCARELLEYFSMRNDTKSLRDSLHQQFYSLEEAELMRINSDRYLTEDDKRRGGDFMEKKLGCARELYEFRREYGLHDLDLAIKLVEVVLKDFVRTYGTPLHDGTVEVTEISINAAFYVIIWMRGMLANYTTPPEINKIHKTVNNACISRAGQVGFLDIISGVACKSNTKSHFDDTYQNYLFKHFIGIVSALCVPQYPGHLDTIHVLEASTLSYKMLLTGVYYIATNIVKSNRQESDLRSILDGLQVLLQMIAHNSVHILEQTVCEATTFRSNGHMMSKFRQSMMYQISTEERQSNIKILQKYNRGQDDHTVLKYMQELPTVCHIKTPHSYFLIQHTLSYINLTTLLEKIDALATTSLGIQGMSKELNRHMESYWTNTPLSPPTDP